MQDFTKILSRTLTDYLHHDPNHAVEEIVKVVFESLLLSERKDFLANCPTENKGNGYYGRLARILDKYLTIQVPRDREGLFRPVTLELLKLQDKRLQDLSFQLYIKGLSTREISTLLKENFGKRFSPSSISNITGEFQKIRESWEKRPLEAEYLFLYVDALWIPVRRNTSVEKEAFYVVMGLKPDLKREILGVYNIPTESASGWQETFQNLKSRGFKKCLMVIADGITGLESVVATELPSAHLQKCLLHKLRNILLKARTSDKEAIVQDFWKVFQLENQNYTIEEGRQRLKEFIEKWKKSYSQIGKKFQEEQIQCYFAYLHFPHQIHRMIYTTNWIERLMKSIRRTQRLRNAFPNPDSAMNLICATVMDMEERVYKYPITSIKPVINTLKEKLKTNTQTHFS